MQLFKLSATSVLGQKEPENNGPVAEALKAKNKSSI